ncbi:MAG: sigma-E factor negative regulatory protein [Nitrosomonas sp.]|nr:sigma-E factor negative regulatory protein [Nitrosomonas sp.]MBP6075343.1 sigma-E factor negative regulatory protein [Nitrosomonas sp.]
MKSKVSALMDGELDKQDALNIIEAVRRSDELQEEWESYHLIGDALRQSSRLSMNISSSVSQKLKTEPTVLFPNNTSSIPKQQKHRVFAFSMAASVVVISAWVIMYNSSYESHQPMVAENSSQDGNLTVVPMMVSSPTAVGNYPPAEINDYLLVHREFSPGTNMRGQVTNVHNTEYHERYGR